MKSKLHGKYGAYYYREGGLSHEDPEILKVSYTLYYFEGEPCTEEEFNRKTMLNELLDELKKK